MPMLSLLGIDLPTGLSIISVYSVNLQAL